MFNRIRQMPYRFDALATYNAEVARGIVHTEDWKRKMAAEQEAFNDATYGPAWRDAVGGVVVRRGG